MYTETALLAALCAALTLIALDGSAQTSKGKMPQSKDYYLLESKKQKTAGWISLAAGFAGFAIGAAMDRGNLVQDGFIFDEYQNAEKKEILKGIGFTSMVGGAVLLVVGTMNKSKASRISFKSLPSMFIHSSQTITKVQPALSIKIGL